MGSRVTELPLAGLELSQRKPRESSQRMGRLVLWLALAVLLPAPAILQPLDQAVLEEQEQMRELLTSMFIDNHREGRDLEEDMDDEAEGESNLVDDEADTEEGVEVVSSKDPQEIARFNNYMDAIYRRMNAALRAKLMDPMVLNMNAKVAKKDKKDKKKRVERSADLEEIDEDEDEVDRMGEIEEAEEKDKEAKKLARKEKKKKRKNKKNKKDKKDKKERKKELSPEKLKKKEERERKRMEKKAARKAAKKSRVERSLMRRPQRLKRS